MQNTWAGQDTDGVLAAEQARCVALESNDFATLERLIAADLTHTHTRGVTDDRARYFRYIREELEFLECRRGELHVRLWGDIAVMTGPMRNVVRRRGTETRIETAAEVLQVWQWRDERWQLLAFQATSLPK